MLNSQADSKLKQLIATKMKRGMCSDDPSIALLFQMDCLSYLLSQYWSEVAHFLSHLAAFRASSIFLFVDAWRTALQSGVFNLLKPLFAIEFLVHLTLHLYFSSSLASSHYCSMAS